jgi:Protein of unknown function (DUF664)
VTTRPACHHGEVSTNDPDSPDAYGLPIDDQIRLFVDDHRRMLEGFLDGLTEEQVRCELVESRTTLLGLVKHATFVEEVWFREAISGRSRAELGIVAGPDQSFSLNADDTIDSVRSAFRAACQQSRDAVANFGLDTVVVGNRRGPLPLRWIMLHVLRELAQHCGHADILREQLVSATR